MKYIKDCFLENTNTFTNGLIDANFSPDDAIKFLPEAVSSIQDYSDKTSFYQAMNILLTNRPHLLLRNLDVSMIAIKSEMSQFQVTTGLRAIAPILLQTYSAAAYH